MSPVPLIVVVPTHGRPTLLRRTLESVARCDAPASYIGCIVVENGTEAGAEALVEALSPDYPEAFFRYLYHPRANKSDALNAALKHVADGTLCVFLDDDVRFDSSLLQCYHDAVARAGAAAYFGGPVSCDYEAPPPSWLIPSLPHSARGYELDDRGTMTDEYLGFNWAAFSHDIRGAGGFNPDVGPGSPTGARGQETDMQRRLRVRDVNPADVACARVWHYVPRNRSTVTWFLGRRVDMGRTRGLMEADHLTGRTVATSLFRSSLSFVKQALRLNKQGMVAAASGAAYNWGTALSLLKRDT
ncbi:MAG: glycosyltransferase family A protein [Bacteroidota bacterium]